VSVRLERRYRSRSEAERVWRAVAADNPEFVAGAVDGERLTITASSASPASLRMTLDDLIACLAAAERSDEAAGPSRRSGRASASPDARRKP
jgi:hypothetical protein